MQARSLRVRQCGVVDHGRAAHRHGHALGVQRLDQKTVQHDLPRIVRQIQNRTCLLRSPLQRRDIAGERRLFDTPDRADHLVGGQIALGAEVDQVAGDRQAYGQRKRFRRAGQPLAQLRQQRECQRVVARLRCRIRILDPGHALQIPVQALRHDRRRLLQIGGVYPCCNLTRHALMKGRIIRHAARRVQRLTENAGQTVQTGIHAGYAQCPSTSAALSSVNAPA